MRAGRPPSLAARPTEGHGAGRGGSSWPSRCSSQVRDAAEPVVGPEAAERLAELGITRISLLQDRSGIGVVLEGWAFDPARVDEAVRAVFPDGSAGVRILHEIEHVAVSMTSGERRT